MNPLERDDTFSLSLANPNPSSSKTKDGPKYRVSFELSQEDWQCFMDTETSGMVIEAQCQVTGRNNVMVLDTEKEKPPAPYGQEAKTLWQSGFFYNPHVWAALGTDQEFLDWVKLQPSCISGKFSEYHDDGSQYSIPCHVRRAGEAGTAYKPEYSAVPMTKEEHDYQHQHGEAGLLNRLNAGNTDFTEQQAQQWFDKQRMDYVSQWASIRLKEKLEYDHLNEIPPAELYEWAVVYDLQKYLPRCYKEESHEPA